MFPWKHEMLTHRLSGFLWSPLLPDLSSGLLTFTNFGNKDLMDLKVVPLFGGFFPIFFSHAFQMSV